MVALADSSPTVGVVGSALAVGAKANVAADAAAAKNSAKHSRLSIMVVLLERLGHFGPR